MKSKHVLFLVFFGILCFLVPASSYSAEIKTFTHTVKQPFGGSQSPDDARIGALVKAKREVLEKAGTYLESLTVVKNNVVDQDEILALAAGVLDTEIVSQENYATENAFGVIITARIVVDTGVLEERIEKLLQDQTLLQKNKEAQQRIEELLAQNKQLEEENRKLSASASPDRYEELRKQFQTVGQGFAAVELLQKALSLFKVGKFSDPKKALEYLNQALDLDPGDARAYSLRGLAHLQLNLSGRAISDCNQAVRLSPDSDKVYLARGHVYKSLGHYKSAIKDFSRAIRINPQSIKAYAGRGAVFIKAGKKRQGCADLKKACQLGFCTGLKRAVQNGLCEPAKRRKRP